MPKAGSSKKNEATITIEPDCDKLGLIAATLVASIVLSFNLFFRPLDILVLVFRVSVTFVVTWAITALVIRYILYATDAGGVLEEQEEEAAQGEAIGEEAAVEGAMEEEMPVMDRGEME